MGDQILNDEAEVEKGENARMSSFVGAIAIADLVRHIPHSGKRKKKRLLAVTRQRVLAGQINLGSQGHGQDLAVGRQSRQEN